MGQPHRPKAWYSAAPDGRVWCHRCQQMVERDEVDTHTAVCWPEVGRPYAEPPCYNSAKRQEK